MDYKTWWRTRVGVWAKPLLSAEGRVDATAYSDAEIQINGGPPMKVESVRWAIEERKWTAWTLEEGLVAGKQADPRKEFSAVLWEELPRYSCAPSHVHFTFRSVKHKLFVDVPLLHALTIDWLDTFWPEAYLCEGHDIYIRGGEWEFVPGEFTWGKWWAALCAKWQL